jgi:nucleoside-diphosphate-sugar epimerase
VRAGLTKSKIAMVSDGSPWRPIVHIEDICEAMRCVAEAPADAVNGQVFNVGETGENFRIREIAHIVAQAFPGCEVSSGPPSQDNRSYRVSFDKIASKLPGFKARWTAFAGGRRIARAVRAHRVHAGHLRISRVHTGSSS